MAALLIGCAASIGCSTESDQMEGLGPANPVPLETAAGRGDLEEVDHLLAQGVDPNRGIHASPLMAVVDDFELAPDATTIVVHLLDAGADIEFGGLAGSDQGPLHRAALRDHGEMVNLLLERAADPCREVEGGAFEGLNAFDIAEAEESASALQALDQANAEC